MVPDPEDPRYIKTATRVFRYDDVLTTWGWFHDLYYDIESQVYIVMDFPQDGDSVEIGIPLEAGTGRIITKDKEYRVKVMK